MDPSELGNDLWIEMVVKNEFGYEDLLSLGLVSKYFSNIIRSERIQLRFKQLFLNSFVQEHWLTNRANHTLDVKYCETENDQEWKYTLSLTNSPRLKADWIKPKKQSWAAFFQSQKKRRVFITANLTRQELFDFPNTKLEVTYDEKTPLIHYLGDIFGTMRHRIINHGKLVKEELTALDFQNGECFIVINYVRGG